MDKKELLINALFFIVTIPIISFIFYQYTNNNTTNKTIDYANPLNLQIKEVYIGDNIINLWIYNPNNFTVVITSTLVGIRNSFGSVGPVTTGGDLGTIKTILPHSEVKFSIPIITGTQAKIVLEQWKKAGGNLTIVFYYNDVEKKVNGLTSIVLQK